MKFSRALATMFTVVLAAGAANAMDHTITLKDAAWQPANLEVKAGEKFKLTVKNDTDKAAEFESDDIDREKVVAAHSSVVLDIAPLKAGSYEYFNEFHEESKGTITAK